MDRGLMRVNKFFLLLFLLISSPAYAWGIFAFQGGAGAYTSGGDYCSSQSWNTLTSFRLDFAHTDDNKTACLASGTEIGSLSGATIATPAVPSPGSGGDALLADASNENIVFDNPAPYFRSLYGELYFMFNVSGDNTGSIDLLNIIQTPAEDRLELTLEDTGKFTLLWEDNNGGGQTDITDAFDLDSSCAGSSNCYGDWIQVHIKWNTTLGTTSEVGHRYRVDDNRDGDFGDGGAEDWTTMEYINYNANVWAAEPSANDFVFGYVGTRTVDTYIDDVEISYDAP